MEVVIKDLRKDSVLEVIQVASSDTVSELKNEFHKRRPTFYRDRQSFRTSPKDRTLKDSTSLSGIAVQSVCTLYFKDLGPQVGWTTVFLTEYAGPLVIYLGFYLRPAFIYGTTGLTAPTSKYVHIAAACWIGHYAKRLLETVFVHRFSHATMPIMNIFRNSAYYWGFAAWVAYFVNHPLYTPALYGDKQVYGALCAFIFCEMGNLSIHVALKNLRPPGTKERKVPYACGNPFTWLFSLVSCPNYTYEVISWVSFSVLSQCLPAALFTVAGAYQMTMWALGKHKNYKREFKNYPRGRKAILPFLL